jgi:hypothetical protein
MNAGTEVKNQNVLQLLTGSRNFPAVYWVELADNLELALVPPSHWIASCLEAAALEQLVPLVYAELHRIAHLYLGGERPGHTLETTELVNEAYLRLIDARQV